MSARCSTSDCVRKLMANRIPVCFKSPFLRADLSNLSYEWFTVSEIDRNRPFVELQDTTSDFGVCPFGGSFGIILTSK